MSQTTSIKTRAEIEELKDFRKLHKANCCLYFMHLGLLSLLLLLMLAWQAQKQGLMDSNYNLLNNAQVDQSKLVFDPVSQEYINPNDTASNNATSIQEYLGWRHMSFAVVLRDFIRGAFGLGDASQQAGGFSQGKKT
jgi:hypothetical protein